MRQTLFYDGSEADFVARIRRMRPMQAAYPRNPALRPLFDACGPPRDV